MDTLDFSQLSPAETAHRILGLAPEQIQSSIPQLSIDQVQAIFAVLDQNHTDAWSLKLRAALAGVTDYPKLEAAGKSLNVAQALDLLDYIANSAHPEFWKLSPLFVGMPHAIFKSALVAATPKQHQVMKHEVIHEPVQHQMTVLCHELVHQLPTATEQVTLLESMIDGLEIKDMGYKELKTIRNAIEQMANFAHESLTLISKVLGLAWNTNRTDLIEKLSQAKELSQKYFGTAIGAPRTATTPATGLFAKLDNRLQIAFGNPSDPHDIETAENDEPALEALVKFSVWYPVDYWDIGLLPTIVDPELFQHIDKDLSEDKAQKKHEELYAHVRRNLEKMGLNTVGDLKEAGIFSRKSLEEFIQRHYYLLRN